MIVVTANWRISDGTLAAGPSRRALAAWRRGVRLTILRSGFQADGTYRPADAIDLVLAGDTFDWLSSREWLDDLRPWHGGRRAVESLERVMVRSLRCGSRLLATLAAWSKRGFEVPDADRRGRPSWDTRRRVPVRVTVLAGDRDAALEGLGPEAELPGTIALGRSWTTGDILVRHGHEVDPMCDVSSGRPSLAESLAVDLVARFGAAFARSGLTAAVVPSLVRRLGGAQPADAAQWFAEWLDAGGVEACLGTAGRKAAADCWNRSVAAWHRAARRLPPRVDSGVDLVDCLAERLELRPGRPRTASWSTVESVPVWSSHPGGEASIAILGHLPQSPAPERDLAHRRPRLVGLVPRGLPRAAAQHEDQESVSVVVRLERGGRTVEGLHADGTRRQECGADDDQSSRGVWVSGWPAGAPGIVDAA